MADVTQQQVVEYIKGISVMELSQLVKALETELGVSAAAARRSTIPASSATTEIRAPVRASAIARPILAGCVNADVIRMSSIPAATIASASPIVATQIPRAPASS